MNFTINKMFAIWTKIIHIIQTALTAGPPTSISPSFKCTVVGVFRLDSLQQCKITEHCCTPNNQEDRFQTASMSTSPCTLWVIIQHTTIYNYSNYHKLSISFPLAQMFSSKETRLFIDYVWKILLQLQHILILTARCSDVERTVILY